MKWVRCPSCRTVNDVDRYAMCDGCNRELTGEPPVEAPSSGRAAREGERDSNSGHRVLWVIAVVALVATFFLPPIVSMVSALLSFVMLTCLFMNLGLRSVWRSRVGTLLKIGGTLLAIVAALGGAFLLVAIACSVSLQGLRL